MKILANDGISTSGQEILEKAGFNVNTTTVAQSQLVDYINKNDISTLLVRSTTEVRKDIIDKCPSLKIIGRGGVGMDNIDVEYAEKKGIHIINTPAASSESVAELVFAHLFGSARFLHDANRNMPLEGDSHFKKLKNNYAKGVELRGKTIGIIGFGKIGQATARMALGLGMKVIYHTPDIDEVKLDVPFFDGQSVSFTLKNSTKEEVLKGADFLTLHVPAQRNYVLGKTEIAQTKKGVGIINTARGGIIDEVALVNALDSGHVSFAGLDVFESEPTPEIRILMHPNISLTPHIGGTTIEAQNRIGEELATQIISLSK
ncbi:MAG: D-2-hydroxyacid dehydrogenase [Cellulophaga sp.]